MKVYQYVLVTVGVTLLSLAFGVFFSAKTTDPLTRQLRHGIYNRGTTGKESRRIVIFRFLQLDGSLLVKEILLDYGSRVGEVGSQSALPRPRRWLRAERNDIIGTHGWPDSNYGKRNESLQSLRKVCDAGISW
jgi:hypothetical protein